MRMLVQTARPEESRARTPSFKATGGVFHRPGEVSARAPSGRPTSLGVVPKAALAAQAAQEELEDQQEWEEDILADDDSGHFIDEDTEWVEVDDDWAANNPVGGEDAVSTRGESNNSVGGTHHQDTAPHRPFNTKPPVTLRVSLGHPGSDGEHEFPWTGSDLQSYLRRVRGGVSLALRARMMCLEPEIHGPLRLYYCPKPGEVIVLQPPRASVSHRLGQRFHPDAEVSTRMRATAVQIAQERAAGRTDPGTEAMAMLARKLLGDAGE